MKKSRQRSNLVWRMGLMCVFVLTAGIASAETFTFNATVDSDFLNATNWSGSAGGTATPTNMAASDAYVVAAGASLAGSSVLNGHLTVNSGVTLVVATNGALDLGPDAVLTVSTNASLVLNGGSDVVVAGAGMLSNFGSVTIHTSADSGDPTTFRTGATGGFVNQLGATFLRVGTGYSAMGGLVNNHGSFVEDESIDPSHSSWEDLDFTNGAMGVAVIRARVGTPYDYVWNNAGEMTAYQAIGFDGKGDGGGGQITNSGTLNLPVGSAESDGFPVVNTGVLNVQNILVSLDNTGTVNLTGPTIFSQSSPAGTFVNGATGAIHQGSHQVTLPAFGDATIVNEGTWDGYGEVMISNGVLLNLAGGSLINDGSWTFAGDGSDVSISVGGLLGGGATLTVPSPASLHLTGGDLAADVTTAAPVTLTADSTVSGALTLDGAAVSGAHNLHIAATGELSGNGAVAGPVLDDGRIAPGSSIGTLGTGDTTLNGVLAVEIDGATADLLNVTGNLTFGPDATIDVSELTSPATSRYVIATYTGTLSGSPSSPNAGYGIDTSVPGEIAIGPVFSVASGDYFNGANWNIGSVPDTANGLDNPILQYGHAMTATNSIEVASGSNTVSVLTVNGLLTMNAGELELGFNPSDQSPHSMQSTLAIGPQGHVTFASSWVYGGYGDVPPGITNQVHIDLATGGQLTSDSSYGGFGMRLWSEWTDTTGDGKTWTLNGTDDGGAGTPSFEGVLRTLYAAGLLTRNGGQSGFFDYDFIYTPGLTGTSGTLEARDITSPDVHVFMGYVSSDFLDPANWLSEGTPTPGAMAAGDTYFVAAAATLQGAASLEGTLEVLDGITLTVGTSGALTVTDATVSGPGSLAVNGLLSVEGTNNMSCSLTLESTNASGRVLQIGNGGRLNNSGIVHHVAGEALINGYWEHGQSPLLVEANATLSGTGYIKGPVTVYGTLHPGPEVGTGQLTIQGQYYCSIDSTTRIRVNGSGTSSFDRILVYGGAGVSGTLLVDLTGKPYADPGTYVFLTSSFPEFAYTTRTPVGLDASRTFGYDIATNGQFTITSAGTPYEDWTTIHELSGTNADFTADPDGDGGLNGYEWATGSDPTNALSLVPLTMLVESNSPSLHFTRNTNATDVTIYVQQSTNLLNSAGWTGLATNAAGTWTPPGAVIESGPTSPRDVQIGLSATNAPASYYRLHITRP